MQQGFGRDLIFQTGSEGCHQGGLVASEGDNGPTRDPLIFLWRKSVQGRILLEMVMVKMIMMMMVEVRQ